MKNRQQTTGPTEATADTNALGAGDSQRGPQGDMGNAAAQDAMCAAGTNIGQAPGDVKTVLTLAAQEPSTGTLIGGDGDSGSLSWVDLASEYGEMDGVVGEIPRVAQTPEAAQNTIWFLYEFASERDCEGSQAVVDLGTGAMTLEPIPEVHNPGFADAGRQALLSTLTAAEHVTDNTMSDGNGGVVDPISDPKVRSFEDTIAAGAAARSALVSKYGFDPADRSIEAVEAAATRLDTAEVFGFIDQYLTAFFVHGAGDGSLNYKEGKEAIEAQPLSAFFGNPPGADQLPDGRAVIDCKGYSAVSQLLLNTLTAQVNEFNSQNFTYLFMVPRHQMALLKVGDSIALVDNDNVTTLSAKAEEIAHLQSLHEEACGPWWWKTADPELSGPMDLDSLPSVNAYLDKFYKDGQERKPAWGGLLNVI